MLSNPSHVLDDIVAAYQLERDLLRITANALRDGNLTLLAGTTFIGRSAQAADHDISRLRSRLDEMTVLALWVEFERFIIDHVMSQVRVAATAVAPFNGQLTAHIERQIEFSRFDEILDLYKGWIDSNLIGEVKNIKRYRDWISHRNPKRGTPATVLPVNARVILGTVMDGMK